MKSKTNEGKENIAFVKGTTLPISTKVSTEICNWIKNKKLSIVQTNLKKVMEMKMAVPYKRFNMDVGHKSGNMASGRYPIKAAKYFLNLVNTLKSNAEEKGLNGDNLIISLAHVGKAEGRWHYGRIRGIRFKSTNVYLTAKEISK